MILQLESLPNELFLHGIFPYVSFIDLNYAFLMLNQRFNILISSFLRKRQYYIDLKRDIPLHEMMFTIDYVLPHLTNNHRLRSLELYQANLFSKFFNSINQIKTDHLSKFIVTVFIDIQFDSMVKFLSECFQLQEIKLKVMTNLDSSWANGRKWMRWFESMLKNNRQNVLKTIDICVWCINTNDAVNFDSPLWNREGFYRDNKNWKVRLEPDQSLNRRKSRRAVEFSRSDQDYPTLLIDKEKGSTCIQS